MISILHPSRSRPEKSFETIKKWADRAGTQDLNVIVSVDSSDKSIHRYHELYGPISYTGAIITNDNRSAVDAINAAAKVSRGDILIVVSDDTDCPENWAVDLLKHTTNKTDFIAKTDDGIQDWIITMPIMDRTYYNRFGYVYHPDYLHMFCDTHLSCVADLTGRRIRIPMTFKHLHYSVGGMQKDSVSEKADATWTQGEALFIKQAKNNFGLVNPPGRITNISYINWLWSKGVKA